MTSDIETGAPFSTTSPTFDLTSEPWLPAQFCDGTEKELSLRDVFDHAGEVRRLAGDVPTQDFALIRLLLAICHDALESFENADDWAELWRSEKPFTQITAYLDRHRNRFDLLSPSAPFFQTPRLRTADEQVFSLNRIVADVPNGAPFFTTRFPGVERITFAEAARWVVHAHAYDTSGIKSGVVDDDRVKKGKAYPLGVGWAGGLGGVLAEGSTLRETLLLNLIAAQFLELGDEDRDEDLPAWRRPVSQPGADPARKVDPRPTGLCDLYTWQSRRILLHADAEAVHGVVLTYGDPLAWYNMRKYEPMTSWRRSAPQEKKLSLPLVYMPKEHDPARAAWRGLTALIAPQEASSATRGEAAASLRPRIVDWIAHLCVRGKLSNDMLIRLQTYGMVYGTQQSVVDEIVEDRLQMHVVLLDQAGRELGAMAEAAVSDAEAAARALGGLAGDLAIAAAHNDKRRVQGDDKTVAEIARDTATDRAYAVLDRHFRVWLSGISEGANPRALQEAWQRTVRSEIGRLAIDLVDSAGDAAWNGYVVADANGGRTWRNAASAEQRFWFNMQRALPLAADRARDDAADQEDPGARGEAQKGTENE